MKQWLITYDSNLYWSKKSRSSISCNSLYLLSRSCRSFPTSESIFSGKWSAYRTRIVENFTSITSQYSTYFFTYQIRLALLTFAISCRCLSRVLAKSFASWSRVVSDSLILLQKKTVFKVLYKFLIGCIIHKMSYDFSISCMAEYFTFNSAILVPVIFPALKSC